MTDLRSEDCRSLNGLKVIEVGNIVSAPFASLLLADLGCEIVKVEHPDGGDIIRGEDPMSVASFAAYNRNKRSITLNLKSETGKDAYRRLTETADIIVENLGPGVVDRLDIGYEDIKTLNPEVIYLSIKGFQTGPYGDRPGMDMVAESMGGLCRMTGRPGGRPTRVGASIADIGAALYGILGVLIALRERDIHGEGEFIQSSLYESVVHWMAPWIVYSDLTNKDPKPMGTSHPSFSLYDVFQDRAGDWVFIGVTTARHWPAFCETIGMQDIQDDLRFQSHENRLQHKKQLYDIVQQEIEDWSREELVKALLSAGIPCAPVNRPSDLVDDPQLLDVGMVASIQLPSSESESVQTTLTPLFGETIFSEHRMDPPRLGEHSAEILKEIGFDEEEIKNILSK